MSAPAQKALPFPVSKITTTRGSFSADARACLISWPIRAVQALRRSGRDSVSVAMGSSTSYSICSYMASLREGSARGEKAQGTSPVSSLTARLPRVI